MSIDEAKPEEWDAVFEGIKGARFYDNRPFKPEDAECMLPANHREMMQQEDKVNKPMHYRVGEVEAIDYINQQLGGEGIRHYLEGNILKYMHRWRFKNGVEDLRKARWYLDKLIYEEVQGGLNDK